MKLIAVLVVILGSGIMSPKILAAGPSVALSTEPPGDQIVPDVTLSTVRISVLDGRGDPIPNVKIGFDLKAPVSGRLFSSDFPHVEGTDLMSYELVSSDGVLEFEYLWPIRGSYEIVMSASPTALSPVQFEPVSTSTTLRLSESRAEMTNIIILVVFLAVFGLASGLVLGRSFKAGQEVA